MIGSISKYQAATFIAILFHLIGVTGILFFNSTFIINATAFNLLLMLGLLIWTQPQKNIYFWLFVFSCFVAGFVVEIIGVNTSMLFGEYKYGETLGLQIRNVPLLIGVNWFIIIYCCGISINTMLMKLIRAQPMAVTPGSKTLRALSIIIDGATLAVIFDWLMEPVAIKLKYWQWAGIIPWFNYVCWFLVSILLLTVFQFCKFEKKNKFAVNLLLVQLMFFLVLRTFMK